MAQKLGSAGVMWGDSKKSVGQGVMLKGCLTCPSGGEKHKTLVLASQRSSEDTSHVPLGSPTAGRLSHASQPRLPATGLAVNRLYKHVVPLLAPLKSGCGGLCRESKVVGSGGRVFVSRFV